MKSVFVMLASVVLVSRMAKSAASVQVPNDIILRR